MRRPAEAALVQTIEDLRRPSRGTSLQIAVDAKILDSRVGDISGVSRPSGPDDGEEGDGGKSPREIRGILISAAGYLVAMVVLVVGVVGGLASSNDLAGWMRVLGATASFGVSIFVLLLVLVIVFLLIRHPIRGAWYRVLFGRHAQE
jgi:hypothetical protein